MPEDKLLIYHFTHIDNIPRIMEHGLLADSQLQEAHYTNSGNREIKERRKSIAVDSISCVGDYVPFYYAPRSPMLYTQHINRLINQEELVYIACDAYTFINDDTRKWACTDRNAAIKIAKFGFSLEALKSFTDFSLMKEEMWNNTETHPDRQEKRMAEFLVYNKVISEDILGFVVLNDTVKDKLTSLISSSKTILVNPSYYY